MNWKAQVLASSTGGVIQRFDLVRVHVDRLVAFAVPSRGNHVRQQLRSECEIEMVRVVLHANHAAGRSEQAALRLDEPGDDRRIAPFSGADFPVNGWGIFRGRDQHGRLLRRRRVGRAHNGEADKYRNHRRPKDQVCWAWWRFPISVARGRSWNGGKRVASRHDRRL